MLYDDWLKVQLQYISLVAAAADIFHASLILVVVEDESDEEDEGVVFVADYENGDDLSQWIVEVD